MICVLVSHLSFKIGFRLNHQTKQLKVLEVYNEQMRSLSAKPSKLLCWLLNFNFILFLLTSDVAILPFLGICQRVNIVCDIFLKWHILYWVLKPRDVIVRNNAKHFTGASSLHFHRSFHFIILYVDRDRQTSPVISRRQKPKFETQINENEHNNSQQMTFF